MIKIGIVDDERPNVINLELLIKKYIPNTNIRWLETDSTMVSGRLTKDPIDLLFLDIQMPKISGFDLLQQIEPRNFEVVFVTAYSEYALRAIKLAALDYLLKPIDLRELRQSFHRYYSIGKLEKMQRINYFLYQWQNADRDSKIALPEKEGTIYQEIQDIIYCQAFNNYTKFYFVNRQPVLVANTLKEYENLLAQNGFIRIHKSYLVNVHHVTELNSHDPSLIIHGQIKLPIALARRKEVRMQMQKFVK